MSIPIKYDFDLNVEFLLALSENHLGLQLSKPKNCITRLNTEEQKYITHYPSVIRLQLLQLLLVIDRTPS